MTALKTSDFNYELPPELIAQTPIEPRDASRLLMINRGNGAIEHCQFSDLTEHLKAGDLLIFNNSRVIQARLFAVRADNQQRIEILLLRRLAANTWETLIGSRKRVAPGMQAVIEGEPRIEAEVIELKEAGVRVVRFSDETALPQLGKVPLPPYIHAPLADPERYQTVYAKIEGSVAAPTAGLHFTPALLEKLKDRGVQCAFVTLHVGLNTFRPVQAEEITAHPIFPEYGVIPAEVARQINRAKEEKRRVICVGTTSVRLLESAAHADGARPLQGWDGWVNDFIYPGYQFRVMDALLTNFHLPKSTLLMLVSAFAGKDVVFKAYREAIERRYRFYSFGDAMFIE